ncbi:benzaldehyde dehydrogenase [Sphingomonas sanguinis]|uniref:benzaldehyde dehydrogenase n=1 Tax=Sphingomonas sanguinis TaxID=33051 RepID=UPI001C59603C|nr:benzaldehyde dehydrogenase [Sphingomonas sanguinis]QXT35855.1 benzaldehyde dehydrogenase [Sphingomonas sanguinis]
MTSLLDAAHLDGRFFDGHWIEGGQGYDVLEPATGGAVLARAASVDAATVTKTATAARAAQQGWAAATADVRAGIFVQAAALARAHAEEIVTWTMRESGSVRAKAEFELAITIKAIELAAAMPHQAQGLVLPSEPGRLSLARRRPLGVVGVIAPFNFPLYLAMRAVAPALAVGNAVMLKPDPRTAICGGLVIARLFELAGLPAGVLSVLPGGGEAGAALCADPNVAMIQFTGSTGAGRKVGEAASRHLKKVSLELGGKNTLIVLDDADLDLATRNAAWGAWLHQGQICMTAGRILVHRAIFDAFATRLAEKAKALPVGDPMSGTVAIGPLISQPQLDHAIDIVERSVAAGARLLAGGKAEGLCLAPTVLEGVKPGMAAFEEEIFGPVAVLVPFDTDDEAVALANDTEYGLSAAVISKDVGRAMALGERLRAGLLHINDQTVNDEVVNPFGGVGASGNGSAIGGPANWEEFTHWQWVTVKGAAPAYPF